MTRWNLPLNSTCNGKMIFPFCNAWKHVKDYKTINDIYAQETIPEHIYVRIRNEKLKWWEHLNQRMQNDCLLNEMSLKNVPGDIVTPWSKIVVCAAIQSGHVRGGIRSGPQHAKQASPSRFHVYEVSLIKI